MSGKNQVIRYKYGIDLDTGEVEQYNFSSYDFRISHGSPTSDGLLSTVAFIPNMLSGYSFEEIFTAAPTLEQCQAVVSFNSQIEEITGGGFYVCFQTDEGRLGYLNMKEANAGFGIVFDWFIWEYSEPAKFTSPTTVPAEQNESSDQAFLVKDVEPGE